MDNHSGAVTTRLAGAADQTTIGTIAEACGLFPAQLAGELLASWLAGDDLDLWLVAEREGEVVGFAFSEPERLTDGTWNMRAIGVLEQHRRAGCGDALVSAVEADLRARGARLLVIETSDTVDQDAARRFYAAKGYAEEARVGDFWAAGVAKLIFTQQLQSGGGTV